MGVSGRYEASPVFETPDDPHGTLWRYLDFTKLVSLLDTKRLFFARADMLTDRFEGSYPAFNVESRPHVYKDMSPAVLGNMSQVHKAARRWTFVNCWSLSDRESAALWGLYVSPTGGVAIRSTFQRLIESFGPIDARSEGDRVTRIHVGRVKYVDFDHYWIP